MRRGLARREIVAFVRALSAVLAIMLAGFPAGTAGQTCAVSQHWRTEQEDRIREAVFVRLYREYCKGRSHGKLCFISVGGWATAADPSPTLLARLRSILPAPLRQASELQEDVAYSEGRLRDHRGRTGGVELAVGRIDWKDRTHTLVEGVWGKNSAFRLLPVYRVARKGASWVVTGEQTFEQPDSLLKRGRSGGRTYVVRLAKRPFRLREHRITGRTPAYKVDGKTAIGTDGDVPLDELYTFNVTVEGARWPVPGRLWRDCYELHLSPNGVHARLSSDGSRLTVEADGSDGAGSYAVTWRLSRDGKHTRSIEFLD